MPNKIRCFTITLTLHPSPSSLLAQPQRGKSTRTLQTHASLHALLTTEVSNCPEKRKECGNVTAEVVLYAVEVESFPLHLHLRMSRIASDAVEKQQQPPPTRRRRK